MASNSFGEIFRITTWGESHGPCIGVVLDGVPAGVSLSEEELNEVLSQRAPGKSPYTSPRKEKDQGKFVSGIFEGKSTGMPLSIIIENEDHDSSQYEGIKDKLRPGHANFTYLEKYNIFDYRGGGRASARETALRVAAGYVAKKILDSYDIQILSYLSQVGDEKVSTVPLDFKEKEKAVLKSKLFCPDQDTSHKIEKLIEQIKKEGDSIGGVISFETTALPKGLGDPVYQKLEARVAFALLSIPGAKGMEIGEGFSVASMRGSEHNDLFHKDPATSLVTTKTNHSGGILGGISTGSPLFGRVAFKPTSSIAVSQQSVTLHGEETLFQLPKEARHDPCIAIRAVPVVTAMLSLVLVDALLMHRGSLL